MPTRTTRQRSHILIVDSFNLLPNDFAKAIRDSHRWSVAEPKTRRKPTIALVVVGEHELPSTIIHRFFTTVAAIPIIVYDTTPNSNRHISAFSAGANGYIIPGVTFNEFVPMLELAQAGGFGTCPNTVRMLRERMRAPLEFSRREREVVALHSLGASVQDVADELHISAQMVEAALERACDKAGVESTVALASCWTRWLMMEEPEFEFDDELLPMRYAMSA